MKKAIKGNHAVSHGVRLSRVGVISAYPITPQTTIVEELSEMCARGEISARFIKVESEHSAMASLIGAATAGARTFTASSGNGLLLMHEVLHWTAGARLPIVMADVNRAVSGVWNIWAEQTDSLAQRDTGWIQIYCESSQELLDGVLMAYRLAEKVMLPVMIAYDAFFLSHTTEIVDIPDADVVDRFLPPYEPPVQLNFDDPRMFGGFFSTDYFYEHRYTVQQASQEALNVYPEVCREFNAHFGRSYDLVETWLTDDADTILVTAGAITSVSRIVIERLRSQGEKVGLMKLRIFRPIPVECWRKVLGNASRVVVIDRNLSVGVGGVFAAEIRSALYASDRHPPVYSVIAGLGGRDVTPEDVEGILHSMKVDDPSPDIPLYWGLKR